MNAATGAGLGLALTSTTLTNLGHLRERDAAAALPCLSIRRPLDSVTLLLTSRRWALGFAMEASGFLPYALALALLTLVQSIAAGEVGVLGVVSARMTGRRLSRRDLTGVVMAVLGLVSLAVSLAGGSAHGRGGSTTAILVWVGAIAVLGLVFLSVGRKALPAPAALGIAGGLFFSIGDVSTKVVTTSGPVDVFVIALVAGYGVGTALLQLGYQTGGAVTVAGLATLLSNAVPIVAGTLVLHEPCRPGRSAICGHSRSWRSAQARSCWRSPTIRAQRDRFGGWCHVCAALIACRLTETARARAARTAAVSVSTS